MWRSPNWVSRSEPHWPRTRTSISIPSPSTPAGGSIPVAVEREMGFLTPLTAAGSADRWRCYIDHEDARGKTVLLDAWEADLRDGLEYWLRLVHATAVDPADRPTFLVLTRERDLPVDLLHKEHAMNLEVRWWWNVFGLLDTELCVDLALAHEPAPSPLRRAMLTELIAWEVDRAPECARLWPPDAPASILAKVVTELREHASFTLDRGERHAVDHARSSTGPRALLPLGQRPHWRLERNPPRRFRLRRHRRHPLPPPVGRAGANPDALPRNPTLRRLAEWFA